MLRILSGSYPLRGLSWPLSWTKPCQVGTTPGKSSTSCWAGGSPGEVGEGTERRIRKTLPRGLGIVSFEGPVCSVAKWAQDLHALRHKAAAEYQRFENLADATGCEEVLGGGVSDFGGLLVLDLVRCLLIYSAFGALFPLLVFLGILNLYLYNNPEWFLLMHGKS